MTLLPGGVTAANPYNVVQTLGDPMFLTAFAKPGDVTAGFWDKSLAWGRVITAAPFLAGYISWIKEDSLARAQSVLSSSITACGFSTNNPQSIVVPSECGLKVTFAGSAGVTQFRGSTPGSVALFFSSGNPNAHGMCELEGLWAMGDPTLASGTSDALSLIKVASFWESWIRNFRIYGFLGATRVIDLSGESQLHVGQLHFSRCGALSGTTNAVLGITGNEFGIQVEDVQFLSAQAPAGVPTPAGKDLNLCPGIYRDLTGNVEATGDRYTNIAGGDFMTALIVVKPTSGFVGPQKFVNIWPGANSAGGGAGAVQVSAAGGGSVRGGVTVSGGAFSLNGGSQPAWAFNSLTCPVRIEHVRVNQETLSFGFDFTGCTGAVTIDECSTDTPGQRVPVTNATCPIEEKFQGKWSDYRTRSATTSAGQIVSLSPTAGQVRPTPAGSPGSAVVGVDATGGAANSYGPIQRLYQYGLTVITDGANALSPGSPIMPSTTVNGEVTLDTVGTNQMGRSEATVAATAGLTFPMSAVSGGSGLGITQLTGNVLAGPGTGSLGASVVAIDGPGGSGGNVPVGAASFTYGPNVSPVIAQQAQPTGAGNDFTQHTQAAQATSGAHGGNYRLALGKPDGAAATSFFAVAIETVIGGASTDYCRIQPNFSGGYSLIYDNSNSGIIVSATSGISDACLVLERGTLARLQSPGSLTLEWPDGQNLVFEGFVSGKSFWTYNAVNNGALSVTHEATSTSVTYTQAQQGGTGASAGSPTIYQSQQGQNVASGTNNNGGPLKIVSGAPGTGGTGGASGQIQLKPGNRLQVNVTDVSTDLYDQQSNLAVSLAGNGLTILATSISTSGGTLTLSAAQYACPIIRLTGTLTSNLTVVFPNASGMWFVDISGLTFASNTVGFKSGTSATVGAISTGAAPQQIVQISATGSNGIAINQ